MAKYLQSPIHTEMQFKPLPAADHAQCVSLAGGLVAGTLDIGMTALISGFDPRLILRFITGGLLGKAALHCARPIMADMQDSPSPDATHAIHVIDTGFQRSRFDAAYLIVEDGHAAFIDCGTHSSQPRLLAALEHAGLSVENVDWLILTHVHLDHAGGAGELMACLPHARLVVHPHGARHMLDPSKLWAGATAVYGEAEMRRSYGKLKPMPAERVVEAPDDHAVDLAGRTLRCLDTPGHARHHNAILDERTGCVFSGDTFGLSYREFDSAKGPFIIPTTSPVQFDPEALHTSIRRLVALDPPAIYLTHFGPVTEIRRLAEDLHATIDAMLDLAHRHADEENRHGVLTESIAGLYVSRAHAHGCCLRDDEIRELLAIDIELNAQGLEVWLDKTVGRSG